MEFLKFTRERGNDWSGNRPFLIPIKAHLHLYGFDTDYNPNMRRSSTIFNSSTSAHAWIKIRSDPFQIRACLKPDDDDGDFPAGRQRLSSSYIEFIIHKIILIQNN